MQGFAISEAGLALVQGFEGFRAEPQKLGDGWLVGHGHVRLGEPGAPVSPEQAAQLLALDLAPVERCINEKVTATLTQAQFDALVSFCLSIGVQAFAASDVLRKVNAGQPAAAACAMDAWRKSSAEGESEIYEALILRRAAEKALFLKDVPAGGAPSAFFRAELDHAAAILSASNASSEAPQVGKPRAPKPAAPPPARRLTEILAADPATAPLLLTEIVADVACEEEIATAHAAPVARRAGNQANALGWLRRISAKQAFDAAGLALLLVFGGALMTVAAGLVVSGATRGGDLAIAASLGGVGAVAASLASYCLFTAAPARA
jgi:lysozyme